MLFDAYHGIFLPIIPSKWSLLFLDKHFFGFKKCYLDTIGKLKLGQRKIQLNGSPEDLANTLG